MVLSTHLRPSDGISIHHVSIRDTVMRAARCITPLWPLQNAIACNPLLGFQSIQFWDAVKKSDALLQYSTSLDAEINNHMIKWCQVFFDEGQAPWSMPGRELGLYKSVISLLKYDRTLVKTSYQKRLIEALPQEVDEMLYHAFKDHPVSSIEKRLAQLPGWAGYVVWYSTWKETKGYPCDICEFLALRLAFEMLLVNQIKVLVNEDTKTHLSLPEERNIIEQREQLFDKELIQSLLSSKEVASLNNHCIEAQLVFCIDCRSEPLRQRIEKIGPWKTYGFAGFFGLPIRIDSAGKTQASCPVILSAKHTMQIRSKKSFLDKIKGLLFEMYKGLKYQFGASFALAELMGPFYFIKMLKRLLQPLFANSKKSHKIINTKQHLNNCCIEHDLTIDEQVEYSYGALMMMGITSFAPLVVFCGHGSSTENNPHNATLQCGACAAQAGGMNALLLAMILNNKQVRIALKGKGLIIPDSTCFLAAQHDTTVDSICFLTIPQKNLALFNRLKNDLNQAARQLESCKSMQLSTNSSANIRSKDWSEVRPEWGLAKNACFIIGSIANVKELHLEGRSFLHSYDYTIDDSLQYLQTILAGPLTVAHWINMQYFFSTVRPHIFGSGNKINLNIVGKMGVMQGNASDLMTGLPYQSVFSQDGVTYHLPQRLLTVIDAPKDHVFNAISSVQSLVELIKNEWLRVVVIDPQTKNVYRLLSDLSWAPFYLKE